MKLDSLYAQNKNMKGVIGKNEGEIEKLKTNINNIKEELKLSNKKYNELITKHKQLIKNYDKLNKEYLSLKNEKENIELLFDKQKVASFNLKKEIIELNKIIDNLNNQIKKNENTLIEINLDKKENKKENRKIINNFNKFDEKNKSRNSNNISGNNDLIINKNSNKVEYKNLDDEENETNNENETTKNNNKAEEIIIYNNNDNDDDFSNDEEEENYNNFNNIEKLKQYINNNNKNIKNNNKSNQSNHLESVDYINRDNSEEKITKSKNKEAIKNLVKKENIYTSLIKYKDKIIGCNKEKIKILINDKDYQIVEKELNALIKEKEKYENELLKMPEHPKKLNDIRNKKVINDTIKKFENDINYIRKLLKKADDYYIN